MHAFVSPVNIIGRAEYQKKMPSSNEIKFICGESMAIKKP